MRGTPEVVEDRCLPDDGKVERNPGTVLSSPVMKELAQLRPLLKLTIDRGLHEAVQASRDRMNKGNAPVPPSSGKAGITLPIARDIHRSRGTPRFAQEIQSVGEAVAWTLKVNRHIESLEFDIGNAPARVGAYVTT